MKKKLVCFAAMAMAATTLLSTGVLADAAQSRYFVDMNSNGYGFWAVDEVDGLYEKGVVRGVGANRFAPQNLMERGDFVLMLENAFHYPAIGVNVYNFADVSHEDYYFTAINNARGNGICEDTPVFRPEAPIKRVEAFNMLYNTMNKYGCVGSNGSTDVSMYSDSSLLLNVTDKIAVGTITKLGIVQGSNGQLRPNDTVTRAEMAIMISKAIEVYEANGSKKANTGSVQEKKPVLSGAEAHPDPDRVEKQEETLTEVVRAQDGDEVTVDGNTIDVESGEAVVADGNDSKVTVDGSNISTRGSEVTIASAINGGELELTDVSITSSKKATNGVFVGQNSSATIESSKIFVRETDSCALINEGSVDVSDSNLQSVKAAAVKTIDGTDLDITDSTIKTEGKSNSCISVENKNESGDKTTINLSGVEFEADEKASAILVDNTDTVINVKNVTLNKVKKLLSTRYQYSKGIGEYYVDVNLDGQKLEAELEADDLCNLTLNLSNGSSYKGVLNYSNTARSVNVEMTGDCTLEMDDDWYVDAFVIDSDELYNGKTFADFIKDNGHKIYYNADNIKNDYLNDETHALLNGGVLEPYNVD